MTDLASRVHFLEQQLLAAEQERLALQSLLDARNQDFQESNAALRQLNLNLERLVEERTREASLARDHALAASQAKSEFLAVMSHEIRTPMNAILGFTDLLAKTELTPVQDKYVRRIFVSGKSLLQIINDILDFSKIEAGKLHLEVIDFSVAEVFDQLREVFSSDVAARGLKLVFEVDPSVPVRVEGDPLRFGQIITNLVSNALKFTEQGEVRVHARMLERSGQHCVLEIRCEDTGIGIPESKINRLFTPFTQADSSTTRRYGGTGLGLSICQSLCRLMGGDISARSRPGVGSTFAFTVSFGISSRCDATPLARVETRANTSDFSGARVLLVEDNEINQELVVELLNGSGLTLDIARNGLEALEKVKLQDWDLVFMDIQMPFLDGYEVTRRIRNDIGKKTVPIIAMTANASSEDRERCMSAGMNDFLGKPIAPAPLFALLEHWLAPQESHGRTAEAGMSAASGAPAPEQASGAGPMAAAGSVAERPVSRRAPETPPFDRHKALQMMGGREALLTRMLTLFRDRHGSSVAELESLLASGDRVTAQRLAHTLKGVSANIAADIVKVCAERVENHLRPEAGEPLPDALREDIRLLNDAMNDLMSYLDPLLT